MSHLTFDQLRPYIKNQIDVFQQEMIEELESLDFKTLFQSENPYLLTFQIVNFNKRQLTVERQLQAYIHARTEIFLDNFLRELAIYIVKCNYGGYKPSSGKLPGIDFIFQRDNKIYIVAIHSDTNHHCEVSNSISNNFKIAKKKLSIEYPGTPNFAIYAYSYGKDAELNKHYEYHKLYGQDFWRFISNDDKFYLKIRTELKYRSPQHDNHLDMLYGATANRLAYQFGTEYYTKEGGILWDKLLQLVSARKFDTIYPFEDEN